jgi:hypothetical protein
MTGTKVAFEDQYDQDSEEESIFLIKGAMIPTGWEIFVNFNLPHYHLGLHVA